MAMAFVQSAVASATNNVVPTLASNPTAGNLLVAVGAGGGNVLTISGGGVSSWTLVTSTRVRKQLQTWVGITDGSSGAVTIHDGLFGALSGAVIEFSGPPDGTTDGVGTNNGQSTTMSATGTPASGVERMLIFAAVNVNVTITSGPDLGFTAISGAGIGASLGVAYLEVASTTGSYAPTFTETNQFSTWEAAILALKPTAAAAAAYFFSRRYQPVLN